MQIEFADGTRLYCRTCESESPHVARGQHAVCQHCGRTILGIEAVTTWSWDDLDKPYMFLPPIRLLTPVERFRRYLKSVEPSRSTRSTRSAEETS